MKRKILIVLSLVLTLGILVRIAYVNIAAERPQIVTYQISDRVAYGDNFYERSDEQRNGYFLTVNRVRLVKTTDFAAEQGFSLPEAPEAGSPEAELFYVPEYVVDMEVTIENQGNTEGYIDLYHTRLISGSLDLWVDETIWDALYPHMLGDTSFKIRENTEADMHLPFALNLSYKLNNLADVSDIAGRTFYLHVTQYPVQQLVEIPLESAAMGTGV